MSASRCRPNGQPPPRPGPRSRIREWLKRIDVITADYEGEFQVGHYMYEWPTQPHEPVALMRVRARITDPAPGATLPIGTYTVRGGSRVGLGAGDQRRDQPDRRGRMAAGEARTPQGPVPVAGLVVR